MPRAGISKSPSQKPPLPASRMVRPRHSVSEWNSLSKCPRQYEWQYIRPVLEAEDEELQVERLGNRATLTSAEIGTRVHRAIELKDWDSLHALEKEVTPKRFRAQPLLEWIEKFPWMKDQYTAWSELPFEAPVGGEVLVGAIDRVVFDPVHKQYGVIDFKVTSEKKANDPDQLMRRYRGQLALYTWALGQLEPQARGKTQAWMIVITPERVLEIQYPAHQIEGLQPESLAKLAAEIVQGQTASPLPGLPCIDCAVKKSCPDAR